MNAETYQQYRDELRNLLVEGEGILTQVAPDAPEEAKRVTELRQTAGELTRIKDKLTEDQFTIALVADFQGGKSTTFCTLCDGRLLSPRGFGIKTSGCQISAQNVNGPERAEIHWRTSKEIVAGFGELLTPYFNRIDPQRFLSDDKELDTKLDMNKPEDCALVLRAAQQALDDHQKNRRNFSDALLDVARCAALTAKFYADPHINTLRGGTSSQDDSARQITTLQPEALREHVAFPDDWAERWTDAAPNLFKAHEIVFFFIAQVRLFLNSPSLAETGIRLLDCPGLFASKWDTHVAMDAMSGADAILYLFPGRTAITAQQLGKEAGPDRGGLRMIRGMQMERKLFYGWNIWDGQMPWQFEKLVKSSKGVLNTAGFATDERRFFLFHARLSLMALMAKQLFDGKLTSSNRQILFKEELGQNLDRAPDDTATQGLLQDQIKTRYKNIKGLTQDPILGKGDIADVQEASGQPRMLAAVKEFVISNKASLILLDNGSSVVGRALESLEGSLATREHTARQRQEEFNKEKDTADEAVRKFQADCDLVLKGLEPATPDWELADEFVSRFDVEWRGRLSERLAERLYNDVINADGLFATMKKLIFNKEQLENAVVDAFRSELERAIGDIAAGWLEQIKSGNHEIYNEKIRDKVVETQADIRSRWDQTVKDKDLEVLRNIPLPQIAGDVFVAIKQFGGISPNATADDVKSILSRVNLTLLAMLWSIKALVTAILATIFFGGPLAWVIAAGVVALLVAETLLGEETIKTRLAKKIQEDMNKSWETVEKTIRTEMRKFGHEIRTWFLLTIRKEIVSKPKAAVEQRLREAEEGFKLSQAERDAVAAYAKRRREQDIQPLREKVADYTRRCSAALAMSVKPN